MQKPPFSLLLEAKRIADLMREYITPDDPRWFLYAELAQLPGCLPLPPNRTPNRVLEAEVQAALRRGLDRKESRDLEQKTRALSLADPQERSPGTLWDGFEDPWSPYGVPWTPTFHETSEVYSPGALRARSSGGVELSTF